MVCSHCQRTVPDGSTFCLGCGHRLAGAAGLRPSNGHGTPPGPGEADAGGGEPAVAVDPTRKMPYALSFGLIPDERLRYRVARWVVERAPAHPLADVQAGLRQGDFLTFLALTGAEADDVRAGIERLGVAPALVSLVPASQAAARLPARRERAGARPALALPGWLLPALLVAGLALAGLVVLRLLGAVGP